MVFMVYLGVVIYWRYGFLRVLLFRLFHSFVVVHSFYGISDSLKRWVIVNGFV